MDAKLERRRVMREKFERLASKAEAVDNLELAGKMLLAASRCDEL